MAQPIPLTDLREIQDWIIRPQLRTVKGVTEVNYGWRLCQTVSCRPLSRKTDFFWADAAGCHHRARAQQSQCRRRLYREKRGTVPGPLAGTSSKPG